MELCSLHPISDELAKSYVRVHRVSWGGETTQLNGVSAQSEPVGFVYGNGAEPPRLNDRDLNRLTFGLGLAAASQHPTFAGDGLCLTAWEARVDRGIAMLIRPPSRLFSEAGLSPSIARQLPIRLDMSEGMMGGGYIPARLVPQAEELLEKNLTRSVRRMIDADLDPLSLQGLMMEAVAYARINELGLYEVIGLVDYSDPSTWPSEYRVRNRPVDSQNIERIAFASKPAPKPGMISTLRKKLGGKRANKLAP